MCRAQIIKLAVQDDTEIRLYNLQNHILREFPILLLKQLFQISQPISLFKLHATNTTTHINLDLIMAIFNIACRESLTSIPRLKTHLRVVYPQMFTLPNIQ